MSTGTLSVLTLNVWFDSHAQNIRYPAQLSLYLQLQPDVIALQEVTEKYVALLKAAPDLAASYTLCAPTLIESFYGTAVLVRTSLCPVFSRLELRTEMGREILLARLTVGGQKITVCCVHLESQDNSKLRREQMLACNAGLSEVADAHAIICGDFNFCSFWDRREMLKANEVESKERFVFSPVPSRLFNDAMPSPREPPPPPPLRALENDSLAVCLPSFIDAWPALHGVDAKGFTFDTNINAMIPSVCKRMRYDRVLFRLPDAEFSLASIDLIGTEAIAEPADDATVTGTPARNHAPIFLSDHFGLIAVWKLLRNSSSAPYDSGVQGGCKERDSSSRGV
jgi:exonuclease III